MLMSLQMSSSRLRSRCQWYGRAVKSGIYALEDSVESGAFVRAAAAYPSVSRLHSKELCLRSSKSDSVEFEKMSV
jgi:hypothetical protein